MFSDNINNLGEEIKNHSKAAAHWESIAELRPLSDQERLKWIEDKKLWITKERIQANMWKQKARIKWTLERDENSKFFHSFVKRRGHKNYMRGISINGTWSENPQEIKEEIFRYFSNIFKSNTIVEECYLDFYIGRVTEEDNTHLEERFSEDEIWTALKSCCSSKAPEPNGFSMKFYKKFWWLIKEDVLKIEMPHSY
ncbi:uncharacterized protein [Rutidosis leptorrhynchoides]|uniref:uncharacterized protein n=1 Tax=Rutidosis leptorrhynchoides TaxID=125765 RepID=UPI003A99CCDA